VLSLLPWTMTAQDRQAPAPCSAPLTEAQITSMIRAPLADVRIQYLVGTLRRLFPVDTDTAARLRGFRGSAAVLSLLQ